jgi:hypothetical protein
MSTTQITVQPPTPVGTGLFQSIMKDNFTANQTVLTVIPPTGGAILSVIPIPLTGGACDLKIGNTANSDGTLSLFNSGIKIDRTNTTSQDIQLVILSRG